MGLSLQVLKGEEERELSQLSQQLTDGAGEICVWW
jgi:hypothetical protein